MNYLAILAFATIWFVLGFTARFFALWHDGEPITRRENLIAFTLGPPLVVFAILYSFSMLGAYAFDQISGGRDEQ